VEYDGQVSTFALEAFDALRRALRDAVHRWNEWHANATTPPSDLPMDAPAETTHPHTNAPLASRDMDVYGEPL